MQTRHRIPTIFSLSLIDMLCCALGAMILLMLVNMYDARRQALDARKEATGHREARVRVEATSKELEATLTMLSGTQEERDAAMRALAATRGDLTRTQGDLKTREQESAALAQRARLKDQELTDVRTQLVRALQDVKDRQKALAAKEEEIDQQKRLYAAAITRLNLTEKELADAEKMADKVPTLRAEIAATEKRIKESDAELAMLKRRAEEAGLKLADAQKSEQTVLVEMNTLKKLLDEQKAASGRLRSQLSQAENRFAGVDLGGKRVVVLIDMSGSMASVDGKTVDPTKWPEVRRTVVQVLKSLGEAEKFQVLLFSTSTQFVLGKPGQWHDYDRAKSPDQVERALAAITPQGDTNLHAAFEAAFQFKLQGMDAIYLFSDGLPNIGPGLPANPPTDENAREGLLGKHVRDTIRTRWNAGQSRVKIHSVGFFYESPNLGAFLWALSRENGGSFVGMSRP